jgi:V/A-type H+-transporting ATPase subunit I
MAIVKMSNFSLFAFDSERENLLHELQKFEFVHFLNLNKDESLKEIGLKTVEVPESILAIDEDISMVNYAIDILSNYYIRETGIKAMQKGQECFDFTQLEERAKNIDYLPIYEQLKSLWTRKEGLNQDIEKLKTKIEELNPWMGLDSPIKDIYSFDQSEVILGFIPKKLRTSLENDLMDMKYTYLEFISQDKDNEYLILLTSKDESEYVNDILKNNSFSKSLLIGNTTPKNEISILNQKIDNLNVDLQKYETEIRSLAVNLPNLEIVYEYLSNLKLRIVSSENFLMTESVNVIQGYIPTNMVDKFSEVVKSILGNVYYLEIEDAELENPDVPILLKNSKFAESFESLTGMYALPRYNEIDPTPFLAPFYFLFFGMMGADVGYGLVMLIGTFIVLRKFNLNESTKRFVRFFYYLSFSVMMWGFLYGSIFGGIIPITGLINPAEDYNTLLILSIIFGLIHIYFALGMRAYLIIRDGKVIDAIYDVGFWYLALTGGIVYLLNMVVSMPPIFKSISFIAMIGGMVGIVATGGRSATSIGGKIGGGIYSLYGISSYVGDFVSYSRLMALGLSGGFIAGAVNMMAGMVADKGIIGIIGAIIIFIVGQIFNLGLSLLGAYVHTIRLTFVEFFGKFYEGGGKGFDLFRSKPKYINLK